MAKKLIIAVDLGGTNLKVALINLKYRIISKQFLNTRKFTSKHGLIQAIVALIENFIQSRNLKKTNILGVGLGLPGPIDLERGLVHYFPNIPGWKNVRLKNILEQKLRLPVFLDNDANLMCLAEYKLGAAKNTENAVCLTLGTGVGGGIIIDRKLYRAKSFAAGEIGHMPINEIGPRCNCGGFGCLETYIGNRRIEEQAKKIFRKKITLEELSYLAKRNHPLAKQLWNEVGRHLGRALVGVVNFLSPDKIVIGGGVADAGKILFDRIKKEVKTGAMPIQARHVKIFQAKLGKDAGLIGASILVKEGS